MANEGLTQVANLFQTPLSADVSSSATTLTVSSTTGLPSPGIVVLGREQVYFTGTTSTTLTGCTRGFGGTTATAHAKGSMVRSAPVAAHHNDAIAKLAAIAARSQTTVAAGDTINATAVETGFATTFTAAAGALNTMGTVLRITAWGTYGTLGSGTVSLRLKLATPGANLIDTGVITTAVSIVGRRWYLQADITVTAVGASGVLECAGEARIPTANDDVTHARPATGSTTTLDLTVSRVFQITATHGASSASNTITQRQLIAEVLN